MPTAAESNLHLSEQIKHATELGYKALFVTVDSAGIGKRETDLRYTPGGSAPRSKRQAVFWLMNR